MDDFDRKVIGIFPGKSVRKDLTAQLKKGANVPTYVLEYLLGMYCTTDDEEELETGLRKIRKILSENYVRPDQSDYIKSKIKESGGYTIIDKVTVRFDEREDKYAASFTNLKISEFEVGRDLVTHNEKLLIGGIWCIVKIAYVGLETDRDDEDGGGGNADEDIFGGGRNRRKLKKKKSKYDSPFSILTLKPIQMANLDLDEMIAARSSFTKDEWITLLLRSTGYEPDELSDRERMHYLLRFVPMIQKNYNLVELGPRGTGKSHVYSELSPYSILMSSGHTTVSNMFYNMASHRVGLVGNWDCIAFDEVGSIKNTQGGGDMVQTMKNYMANGNFARGSDSISSDASIAFEGNTFRSVEDMMRTTNLFEPFPSDFNNDSAFFDRIHAYLPGWETPKLRASLFTSKYGLISDCFSEFCHAMRRYDFTDLFDRYFELNGNFNTRDDIAVRRTFSGLAKLIYPDEKMDKEEMRELLEYSIECRRRVKEQLRKMNPMEFGDTSLGYTDIETGEEHIVRLRESSSGHLISENFEKPGYVYAAGRSYDGRVGIYRFENKLISGGTGQLSFHNVGGLGHAPKDVHESIRAAFNYFRENCRRLITGGYEYFDYSFFFNDLQGHNVSAEVSVAEVVGLFSVLSDTRVKPATVVCGKVVMSGEIGEVALLDEIIVAAVTAGASTILLPEESRKSYDKLSEKVTSGVTVKFYRTPFDAVKIALGVSDHDD